MITIQISAGFPMGSGPALSGEPGVGLLLFGFSVYQVEKEQFCKRKLRCCYKHPGQPRNST